MIGSFSVSWHNFLTSLILSYREIPVEYKLITCLHRAFPVFSPFSFNSRCLYSAYFLFITSSLTLSTLSCVHLYPNKCALPLFMALFKHSRFSYCSIPSFSVSAISLKKYHRLIYFQHHPLPLLHIEISNI